MPSDAATRAALTQSGLNLIPQAISIFDANLRLAACNRSYRVMFTLPEELTVPGASFEDTIQFLVERGEYGAVPDIEDAVRQRVDQARTFQPHYMERTRANGRTISVEGAPLSEGGWIAVYTDITDIRRHEAMLRARSDELSGQVLDHTERLSAANRALAATNAALEEAKRVLTEAEARTRHVTAMVPAHIAHMDAAHRYTFSNNQLSEVFPGAAHQVIGLTAAEALGEATWARIAPQMERALAGDPQVFEITHEPSLRRVRVALTPDPGGPGVYILSTDVTAEVQAREALTHAARRALGAQLTSGLAHDFGNLLTIILALQDRLARATLPQTAADDVAATIAAARRGTALLSGLAAITAPRQIVTRPTDLTALLSDLAAMARPSLGAGTTLELALELPGGPAMIDPGPLQDSLLNLIFNARDAMQAQGGGQVTLAARLAGPWLELSVTDTGPGFAPGTIEQATQPFFTTKTGQGSGLGLSMVYDQTKLAGGTLRLRNTGTGARVTIRLPWRPVMPRMVLLVDDEAAIRAQVRDWLTAMGHAVIEAASLSEARDLADLPGLSLVLSDLQLGDGLGLELAGGPLPALLMTSLPPEHPLRAGARVPVLQKPLDPATLAAALTEIPDAR
ncbi:response regulator [Paracoccus suum]|uniref:histidine kinase n=1 Tax=Paracoccus suum TaxID=2259340 RepID=A0A344PHV0_9RHOB|nr:PAS-domain containing protein [Paracoccus suum]AXC48955.1 response regulator [Paracoccus suum]